MCDEISDENFKKQIIFLLKDKKIHIDCGFAYKLVGMLFRSDLVNKKHSFEPIRINRIEEFDMTQMTERLKAPSTKYAESVLLKDDPKELLIAVNEFAYNISKDRINMTTACYWIEWMIDFDTICKKRKEPVYAERRKVSVENKYQCDIIWILSKL
jgi:hypothetical protein